ncbi:MAG: homoserine dehydrogenase, partial [Halieaceae bacterium]|nr:homoserine dehydrogenase [Halieaceae bacterium]
MSSNLVKIGICGLGTVGSGTFNVLNRNAQSINARAQAELEVIHI